MPRELMPSRQGAAGVTVTVSNARRLPTSHKSGTIRPGASVRRRELDQAGFAPAELDGGTLVFGGRSRLIEAHGPRPGPEGEVSGEILMHLTEAADA